MSLNMDFELACKLALDQVPWVPSPGGEVERKKLEREGEESGWATTVVRFPPGSKFPAHGHPGGEEFLVLEGVFSDEHADFPKYSYVRNPPGTSHTPFSEEGCVLFVKLCQMHKNDREEVNILDAVNPDTPNRILFQSYGEEVSLRSLKPGEELAADGIEILLLDGTMALGEETCQERSWIGSPRAPAKRLPCRPPAVFCRKGD